MIIKHANTNKIIAESKKDLFLDGKHIGESDFLIEHTVGKITYLVWFDRDGITVRADSEDMCDLVLKPRQIAGRATEVTVTGKIPKGL
jgi:hypothetical protein